jgi:hypothetical protein
MTSCPSGLRTRRGGGGSNADSSLDHVPPPPWRHRPINQGVIDGKTEDHGDVLKRDCGLATRKVERVGLRMPPVHQCHQRRGVHQWQTAGDEPSKREEPCTTYERCVPLVLRKGAVRANPDRGQHLQHKISK